MKRRAFIAALGSAAVWPLGAQAERLGVRRVGLLQSTSSTRHSDAFLQSLREAGFIEGQNMFLEYRAARGVYERLPGMAAELVDLRVDLIAAFGTPAARAAKAASASSAPAVPVIFAMASDPVAEGLVERLNRPGGNVTGVTSIAGALAPKRIELIREFLRDEAVLAILINPGNQLSEVERTEAEAASRSSGQRLEVLTARSVEEIEKAFAVLKSRRINALIIGSDVFYYSQMQRLAALAAQAGVPAIGPLREFAAEGGLLSYGASIADVNRQAGALASRVLKGEKPAHLPVQQPTKFELVINLKTAKALGLDVPPTLLARADEVIE